MERKKREKRTRKKTHVKQKIRATETENNRAEAGSRDNMNVQVVIDMYNTCLIIAGSDCPSKAVNTQTRCVFDFVFYFFRFSSLLLSVSI